MSEGDDKLDGGEGRRPRRWQGVLASFLVSGAGQYFSGRRVEGVVWFLFFLIWPFVAMWLLVSPSIPGVWPGLVAMGLSLVAWLLMLARSRRDVTSVRGRHWVLLVVLLPALPYARAWGVQFVGAPFYMPTRAMEPTLRGESQPEPGGPKDGDYLVARTYPGRIPTLSRGDVVVFRTEGLSHHLPVDQFFVKRVIGLPGERIAIDDQGRLLVNGTAVEELPLPESRSYKPASPEGMRALGRPGEVFEVPADHAFVVGDNVSASFDSRHWGPLPLGNVVGKVTKIYWPPDRAGAVH
jgi:signal peptidase I